MKNEIDKKSDSLSILSKILFVSGAVSLAISIYQLADSNLKYGILSLFYTSLLCVGGIHNRFLIKVKSNGLEQETKHIIVSSVLLGIFLGITSMYILLVIIL